MRAVTASIVHEDPYMAGRDTAAELLAHLERASDAAGAGRASLDVVMVFVSSRHDPERVLAGMWSRLPATTRLLGCSSFAEIGDEDAVTGSVTAMGLDLRGVELALFRKSVASRADSRDVGRAFGQELLAFAPALVVMFPDGSVVNSPQLVSGLEEILGGTVPIVGGVSADRIEYASTYELFDREVLRGSVVALALRGPIEVVTTAKAGFQPIGVERTCTRVEEERLVLELDGVSALRLYEEMLGPDIHERPNVGIEYPLAVVVGAGGDYMDSGRSHVIRVVRHLDKERGGLLCGSDIYEGSRVRITRGAKADLLEAAALAMAEVKQKMPDPDLAFIFSCAGRKLVLGSRYHEEIRRAFESLPAGVPRVGFYTYGEIAPVDGVTRFHAETFTVTLVRKR